MSDRWARWLLDRRFGGDPAARERMLPGLMEFRDRVLAGAAISAGDIVLDVGCGDGLLGIGALECDPAKVIFSDISLDLLAQCRDAIDDPRAEFVHTGLPELEGFEAGSVDVAMTRSVLIYVDDKAASFASLRHAPNPLVPTLGEILAEALTPRERASLAEHIRARQSAPDGLALAKNAVAYLTARV